MMFIRTPLRGPLSKSARGALMALGLVLTACSGDSSPADDLAREVAETTTTSTTTSTTTTTTTTPPTTTTSLAPPLDVDDVPRVARTTTDVVLPVLSEVSDGLLVRTTCQNTTIIQPAEVDDRVHVVLDPGHGGSEPGAATDDGIAEKDVNLEVALQTEALLLEQGFDVILTRYTDIRMPLLTRVEIADRLEADLLVSIHHQGTEQFPTSSESGVEVFYQQDSSESRRFAGILVEETREEFSVFDIEWFAGVDAGAVYRPNTNTGADFYGMIRLPETTSVLAEMAFLGNEAEVDLIRSGELQQAEAIALSQAIIRWLTTDDPGSGFVEPSFSLLSAGGGGGVSGCEDPDLGETFDVVEELDVPDEDEEEAQDTGSGIADEG